MKEIQEIMLEMDDLINKIAVDGIEQAEEKVAETEETESTKQAARCTDIDLGDFCCTINIPCNFEVLKSGSYVYRRISYDLSCLTTKVEPHCVALPLGIDYVIRYDVKVVGCIPFIINVGIDSSDLCTEGDTSTLNDALCCCGCICVDETICTTSNEFIAFRKADSIDINCNKVNVDDLDASIIYRYGTYDPCGVKVTGTFVLDVAEGCCSQ